MRAMMPALGLAFALACAPAMAQDDTKSACTGFAWSLAREQTWFEAPGLPQLDSGATLAADARGAALRLKPTTEAELPAAPTRGPKPGTYAGFVKITAPSMPGVYQLTLSDEGWLDVIQDGDGPLKSVAHTGKRGCPSMRKSLRFRLDAKPIVVEISNATSPTVKIAFAPAE